MRTKNSIKNIISSFINTFILNVLRFVSRMIFIKTIGEVYLGVNGLLSNVLGLLSLAELGIGSAISFTLYKPLADGNESKIRSIMLYYKKAYRVISLVVLVMGLILLPFLPNLIKDTSQIQNLSSIYLIFLINMVIGYLFSYKRTLVDANQKNYTIVPIIVIFNLITTITQIIVLLLTKNFIIYLLVQSMTILLENIFVNCHITKNYPYLKNLNEAAKLDSNELKGINKEIKALFFHKIGSYAVNSTDNIIISKMIGIVTVGIYSNYLLILNTINSLMSTVINNMLSSVGNLIVKEAPQKRETVFNELRLFCFFAYGISTICFINLFNPFITLWLGEEFLLSTFTVIVLSINNYFFGINYLVIVTKTAGGLFDDDKYFPIIEAVINLVVSIILAIKMGIVGVFIGTFVGRIPTLIIKPILVYKKIFQKSSKEYFINAFKQISILIVLVFTTSFLVSVTTVFNPIVNLIINLMISLLLPSLVLIFLYRKTDAFINAKARIFAIIKRK